MSKFIETGVIYWSQVNWWWVDSVLHDNTYKRRVVAAVIKALRKVLDNHSVQQDTKYCCQWEGLQFYGRDSGSVHAAAVDITKVLSRFKGVRPLIT